MKYCLSSRVSTEYLKKADEIYFEPRDIAAVPDFIEDYPDKTYIIDVFGLEDIPWDQIRKWNILSKFKLIIKMHDIKLIEKAKEINVKYYLGYPVNTAYELTALAKLGVCYARVGIPLFFQMEVTKRIGVPLRVVPNVCYTDGLPREDGIHGQWMRPEAVDLYDDFVETIEFEGVNPTQEETLYRIYHDQKNWPGELNMIVFDFNHPAINRVVLPEVSTTRLNCGQRCETEGGCRICDRIMNMATEEFIDKTRDFVNTNKI